MKKWTLLTAVVLTGLLIGTLAAKKGEVVLKDGRQYPGDITENSDGTVVIAQGSGSKTVQKPDVKAIDYFTTPEEGYQAKKARIAKDDLKGLKELARWVVDRKDKDTILHKDPTFLNEELGDAAKAIIDISPNDAYARNLLSLYEKNKTTPAVTPKTKPDNTTRVPVGPGPTAVAPTQPAGGRLTAKEVNIIRVCEMQPDEPIVLKGYLKDALWQAIGDLAKVKDDPDLANNKDARDKFMRRPPTGPGGQVAFAMNKVSEDFYWKLADKIPLSTDPIAMQKWKSYIHPWVMKNCGSQGCHGTGGSVPAGGKEIPKAAPPYLLIGRPGNQTDEEIYTNFFVFNEYVSKGGQRLWERDSENVQTSLLLQYVLPVNEATFKHPLVNGGAVAIPAGFKDKNAPLYLTIVNWLTVRPPGLRNRLDRVAYHIELTIPAATAPEPKPPVPPGPPLPPPLPPVGPRTPGVVPPPTGVVPPTRVPPPREPRTTP